MQFLSEMVLSSSNPNLVAIRTLFYSTTRIEHSRILPEVMVHLLNPTRVILVSV